MAETLSGNFLDEFFLTCTRRKDVLEVAQEHLKYNYLPSEEYKEVWKSITDHFQTTGRLITIGLLTEEFLDNRKVLKVISSIKKSAELHSQDAIDQLEIFVKNKMFIEAYDKLGDLFNEGDKEGTFALMNDIAKNLSNFTLKKDKYFTKIYRDALKRHDQRIHEREMEDLNKTKSDKIPTGIKPLDQLLMGGVPRGNSMLILAQSGVGKSKMVKWGGISASRRGYRVLHIQGEGTKKEAEDAYDAGIMGVNTHQLKYQSLDEGERAQIQKALDQIQHFGGEIYMKAYEQFDTATYRDIREYVQEITDNEGPIDLLIVDYLELFDPGDGKRYATTNEGERARRLACANALKNICVEFDIAGVAPTQANDIPPSLFNDPTFVLTRHNISEAKKVVNPFTYFVTINQTQDEKKEGILRLHVDKARFIDQSGSPTIHIATKYKVDRFYDHQRSVSKFGYEQ